jgi:hypothetical protein
MADDLYDRDFYVWTREQAQALRARRAGANDLDWDRLAEEIEDVGSEQARTATLRLGGATSGVDPTRRWTWEQIIGEADDPLERDYPLAAKDALQ